MQLPGQRCRQRGIRFAFRLREFPMNSFAATGGPVDSRQRCKMCATEFAFGSGAEVITERHGPAVRVGELRIDGIAVGHRALRELASRSFRPDRRPLPQPQDRRTARSPGASSRGGSSARRVDRSVLAGLRAGGRPTEPESGALFAPAPIRASRHCSRIVPGGHAGGRPAQSRGVHHRRRPVRARDSRKSHRVDPRCPGTGASLCGRALSRRAAVRILRGLDPSRT